MSKTYEFIVNNYLTLRLNGEETIIFVDGKELMVCRFLMLQFLENDLEKLNEIQSIDEAAEVLDNSHERNPSKLTAKEEFFGHCSNLQAWYEYGYDTNLLHRNIAFPLLKKLTEVGDIQAKKVFKEEIAKRISSGFDSVVLYLLEEEYIEYLSSKELESLILDLDEKCKNVLEESIIRVLRTSGTRHELKEKLFKFLEILNYELVSNLEFVEYNGEKFFVDDNGMLKIHITKDKSKKIENISDIIGLEKIIYLKQLYLWNQSIKEIKGLENLKNLEILNLRGNQIKEIKGLENLNNLKELTLEFNKISEIKGLENLNNLEYLNLYKNKIKEIKGFANLINLKYLFLRNNHIKVINGLESLSNLEILNLMHNNIKKIENIENLKNFKELHLDGNPIPESEYNKIKWKNRKLGYIENINLHQVS